MKLTPVISHTRVVTGVRFLSRGSRSLLLVEDLVDALLVRRRSLLVGLSRLLLRSELELWKCAPLRPRVEADERANVLGLQRSVYRFDSRHEVPAGGVSVAADPPKRLL